MVVYKYVKNIPYEGNPNISMERQTLQKHFWTVDFECPSPWWLVMYARYAVCVCGYSTGPPRDYKAYCCGGPGSPQFSTGAPKHEKLRFFCQN